jgi:benzoyl-CoA 2,3-dioxygenase component B
MNDAGISNPNDIDAVRALGVIDLPTIQKKINFHVSVTLDLFGSEISTNGAAAFEAGLKGRFEETKIDDDHQLHGDTYPVLKLVDGEFKDVDEPALNAINCRLRDDYYDDAQGGVGRWNKAISKAGIDFELSLPHKAFHRRIGEFVEIEATPDGKPLSQQEWEQQQSDYLPSDADLQFLRDLMQEPVYTPGEFASWIAPPRVGINQQPGDFEYVKIFD